MKRFLLMALAILTIITVGCSADNPVGWAQTMPTMENDADTIRYADYCKASYDDVIAQLGQDSILESVDSSGAVAEYRVLYDMSLWGYFYFSVLVFDDGTGLFTYMQHYWQDFESGEMLVDEQRKLTRKDVKRIQNAIRVNQFWDIPTIHPAEEVGCDGRSIEIEGYEDGETHYITMWEPDENFGIYRIFLVFDAIADDIEPNWIPEE